MDNVLKEQAKTLLTSSQSFAIAVSEKTGFDGIAAALALALCLEKLKKSTAVVAKNPTVETARSLYAVDKIGSSSVKKDLMIKIAKAVENVDDVSYLLDGETLKITIHALPGSAGVDPQDISFDKTTANANTIIAIGYSTLDELKKDVMREYTITAKTQILSINNSNMGQKFAQVNIHEHGVSSLCEVVANLIEDLNLPTDEDIVFNLYEGITQKTKGFSPGMVTTNTLATAQFLIEFGAGRSSFAQNSLKSEPTTSVSSYPQLQPTTQRIPIATQSISGDTIETPKELVEVEKTKESDWLKPPKIYHGSKSFDKES